MSKSKGNPLKVHSKVHFLKMKYSIGFYTGGGKVKDWADLPDIEKQNKLKKDWYVWWSFRDPKTDLLQRQEPNIKLGINIHKTKSGRLKAMKEIKKELIDLFNSGYSPYENEKLEKKISIDFAFKEALSVKIKEVKVRTYEDYSLRLKRFEQFLIKNGFLNIEEVDKKTTSKFLNSFSAKNSNNYRAALSSIFTVLSDLSYVDYNFVKELRTKKTAPKKIEIPSDKEVETAIYLLKKQDQVLLIYIYLVSYMFWRPIETVRIDIENINLKDKRIVVDTKAKANKTKLIPDIVLKDLELFINKRTKGPLFELNAKQEKDRRGYLSARFKKFVLSNGLNTSITPYSFRHYNITKLYKIIRCELSVKDTIDKLSLITGHTSNAIWNYIQVNDVELPEDYSNLLKNT